MGKGRKLSTKSFLPFPKLNMFPTELLAPAGGLEKLKVAVHYGADAVYGGTADFSLRGRGGNFRTLEEIRDGILFAHANGVKFYVTVNSFLRQNELEEFEDYIKKLADFSPDALILSDPGAIIIARRIAPQIEIHLSTQGNNLNSSAVNFWRDTGVKRVILARELSLDEITGIRNNSSEIELECFVHGAICMSYSGKCMLSAYMTGRDANRGDCTQPCRWQYTIMEEKRPGEYFSVEEDEKGTYFFNSKDLCLINHIPELINAGIVSFKIEGRMKTHNYLASVISVYRKAIDEYYKAPALYAVKQEWLNELEKVNTRGYTTAFFKGKDKETENTVSSKLNAEQKYAGLIIEKVAEENLYLVQIKNSISKGEEIETVKKGFIFEREMVTYLADIKGNQIDKANPNEKVIIKLESKPAVHEILRKV